MSIVNDKETLDLLRYGLAIYKFKETQYGFEHLAGYIAALSFDKIISFFAKKEKLSDFLSLSEYINQLQKKGIFHHLDLVKYNRLRNKIVHQGTSSIKNEIIQDFYRILCVLCGTSYLTEIDKRQFEDLYTFGSQKNELETSREYLNNQLIKKDFNDVYELSRKNKLLKKYMNYLFDEKKFRPFTE